MDELKETYRQISRASIIIIVLTLADKLLGIIKEMLVAKHFGISAALDVFNIAYAFPSIAFLIFTGAIAGSFVPLYMEWSNRLPKQQANAYALSLIFAAVLLFGLITLAGYFLSPVLFPLLGYGFGPDEKQMGIVLERFLVFLFFFEGAGIFLYSLLQAQKKFFSLQLAQVFITATIIVLLVLFYEKLGIYTLVWGFLLGTCFKVLYMAVVLHKGGFSFFTAPCFDRSVLQRFSFLALPLLGSALIANVNLLVDQIMATSLCEGSVSTLRYAYRLNDFPIQIIILAIAKAIFPFVSEQAINDDYAGLQDVFKQGLIFLGLLTFPIIAMVGLFSENIVSIVFERGAFDAFAVRQTAQTFLFYNFGLFFYAYSFVNGTFFSALQDTKPMFYMGLVSVVLNIVFNIIFMQIFGVQGIALSTTLSLAIICVVFFLLLKRKLKFSHFSNIFYNLGRILIAALGMFGIGFVLHRLCRSLDIHHFVYLPVLIVLLGACYLLALRILRTKELDFYLGFVGRILRPG